MSGPLAGVRVLDLSRVLAAPWCTQHLGDLGADVVKVERPGQGDDSRKWGPPWLRDAQGRDTTESAYYLSANRNKRSIAIDFAAPQGRALVRELAAQADVLVENYKVGDLARHGLGFAQLQALNPRLVYCSVTGFGQDGPCATRPGYDILFQGLGGIMSVTGEPDDKPGGGPQRVGVPVVDLFTGMYAAIAIVSALHHVTRGGEGQHIDVSLFDSVMALGSGALSNYFVGGRPTQRTGNASPNIAPYEVFACADGQLVLATGSQGHFELLCQVIGRPELPLDPRFRDNAGRLANRDALHRLLGEVFATASGAAWEEKLLRHGVPCGPINDHAQALAHPNAQHRGTRIELPHRHGVPAPGVASPMRCSATPVSYRLPPPTLGQHSREILQEWLAYDAPRIGELEQAGVLVCG